MAEAGGSGSAGTRSASGPPDDAPSPPAAEPAVRVRVRWPASSDAELKAFELELGGGAPTVACLKGAIERRTNVPAGKQKLLNLKSGRGKGLAADDEPLSGLSSLRKPGFAVSLMGTPDAALAAELAIAAAAPPVVDDLDDEFGGTILALPPAELAENVERVMRRVEKVKVAVLQPPRPGKKLLCLDIDYTLIDHRSTVERPWEMARPHLLDFLEQAYAHYDIAIWSATSMKWVELKMREMGVLSHPGFKVSFMLDARAMITCHTARYGAKECKPLAFIWRNDVFGGAYHERNTIMFDDLRRNFVMNPQQGLKVRPFRNCHRNRATDDELLKLGAYLRAIAELDSLEDLDHTKWERYMRQLRKRQREP